MEPPAHSGEASDDDYAEVHPAPSHSVKVKSVTETYKSNKELPTDFYKREPQ